MCSKCRLHNITRDYVSETQIEENTLCNSVFSNKEQITPMKNYSTGHIVLKY